MAKRLTLARDYKLATNDFLARGGDGYGMLAGKTHVSTDSGTRLVALDVIDYIEAAKLIDAKVEGQDRVSIGARVPSPWPSRILTRLLLVLSNSGGGSL